MMMKVRRYLRGSGRVLAFVFVASVIWLLFDMAALRISINDANGQLLKERVMREREEFKRQQPSRGSRPDKRGLKHPLQRAEPAATPAGKAPPSSGVKLAEVYRHGGRKQEEPRENKNIQTFEQQKGNPPKKSYPLNVLSEHKKGEESKSITPKAKNVDVKGTKLEKSEVVVPLNKTKEPLAALEKKQDSLPASKKEPAKAGAVAQHSLGETDSKTPEKVKVVPKSGTKEGQSPAEETHPVKTTSKPPNKDVKGKQDVQKEARTVARVDLNAAKVTPKPAVKVTAKDNGTAVGKAGVHKVLTLDVTLVPRNAKAIGQFGQAAFASSNEDAEVRKRWDEGYFNVYLSDQIPIDRAVPDTRPDA